MANASPPLSPRTTLSASTQPQPAIPSLPHDILAAAHCLAPLDDLHLAHLVNELKPPLPVWSIYSEPASAANEPARGPVIESNDRLRPDELADLPAPEAERLHAAYDIEDHLDCSPDRLLVFGPSTPLVDLLRQPNQDTNNTINHPHLGPPPPSSSSYDQSANQVYVARVWFQPNEGPHGLYKWAKGGADLIRFEIAPHIDISRAHEPHPVVINWCPVEVALSQALEVGHQLLALLHSRQFTEILECIQDESTEFRAINPIVWLVDPVEYAHAQLRETTEWGWSEHHVELNPSNPPLRACASCPSSTSSSLISTTTRDSGRRHSKSHLSHELWPLNHHDDHQPQSPPADPHPPAAVPSSSSLPIHSKPTPKNLADDLPSWLDDLLDRRLPRLLSLPDGCLSYELLHHAHPVNTVAPNVQLSSLPPVPFTHASPPSEHGGSGQEAASSSSALPSKMGSARWSMLSAMGSPGRLFGLDQRSLANSVPSFDQHYIPSPGLAGSLRHGQTNTLRYYPCKACAEHAFKLALSHKLNEEKRRIHLPRSVPMRPSRSSQERQRLSGGMAPDRPGHARSTFLPPSPSSSSSSAATAANHIIDCLQSFATVIDHHLHPQTDTAPKLPTELFCCSSTTATHTNMHTNTNATTITLANAKTANHTARTTAHEPVIGLGSKGKALKEAMDREDDEFIRQQRHLNHSLMQVYSPSSLSLLPSCLHTFGAVGEWPCRSATASEDTGRARLGPSKHTWDEGEDVDD
ncbi:hypothetical protein PTTG_02333 [Puccinia triticina 1-1 BBBD Race 1]|uniref:Uncharacterized protein n=1 Tax=Puccinia triticina (isolate 1-1 / race 1 (BBBD)) TaxID=630390 RepID=A0A180G921_PUCT1|nr:hypothetical protein PTTG_02333 [Puccinia triticina 1-1 BBBD Race 1]